MVQHQYTELIFGLNALFKPAAYENESKCPVLSPFNELYTQMPDDFDVDFLVCFIFHWSVLFQEMLLQSCGTWEEKTQTPHKKTRRRWRSADIGQCQFMPSVI